MRVFSDDSFYNWHWSEKVGYFLKVYFEWWYEKRINGGWQWFVRTPLIMLGATSKFPMPARDRISSSWSIGLLPRLPLTENGHLYKFFLERHWNEERLPRQKWTTR